MVKPTFIPPMLATLVAAPFDDPGWLFEVKWDGFRAEAVVDDGRVRLFTRGGLDAAQSYFGPFLDPPTWIDATRRGRRRRGDRARRSGRARLRAAPGADQGTGLGRRAQPVRVRGVRPPAPRRPLAPRRAARGASATAGERAPRRPARAPERAHRGRRPRVLRGGPGTRPRGDHGQGPPLAVPARQAQPMAGRRSRSAPSRSSSSAAGRPGPAGRWTSGRCSSGSTRTAGCAMRARSARASRTTAAPSCWRRSRRSRSDASPFAPPVPKAAAKDARWLRPELVIRAEFAGWTGDGLVRQASYKGIELEKDPRKVIRERPRS